MSGDFAGQKVRGEWAAKAWTAVWLPLLLFVVARAFLWVAANASDKEYFTSEVWARWDSGHYLAIAERGYELGRCGELHVYNYKPDAWCGNTGWLPGYPLVIRVLSAVGLRPVLAGALLSALFQLGSLLVVWNLLLRRELNTQAVLCLVFFTFAPGMVYQHAVFPVSMFLLGAVLCLAFLERERWWIAGVCGAIAAFAYTTGFVLAPVAALSAFLAPAPSLHRRALRAALVAGGVLGGFVAVFVWQQVSVGAWNALFLTQAKYLHGSDSPLHAFVYVVKPLFEGAWRGPDEIRSAQSMLVTFLLVPASVFAFFRGEGSWRERATLLAFVLIFWISPWVAGGIVSSYRSEALLAPAALLIRRLPLPMMTSVITAFVLVAYPIAILFFKGFLV